ncbi:pyridoxamine 5'-phosphate oxidase family protein [Yoonia vestfoldensis]|uniref:pyridoxamine 5'-phosphate oxidase family protein n=1 Tax=Yoonia vestfoldensis TaxID=245188 RepID=UPI00036C7381|nr:pyridoxamine 5'-phosphate oxidase family protein [Yoonia vestfoldensis]
MTDIDRARTDPKGTIWKELAAVEAGMLGITGTGQHMQPMSHHVDEKGGQLWFLTTRDTDLAKALQPGSAAHFVIISDTHDFYAWMTGPIAEQQNKDILDTLWTNTVAELFVDGKDDPALMLIALKLEDAALWSLPKGGSHHGWHVPDNKDRDPASLGVRNHVSFG